MQIKIGAITFDVVEVDGLTDGQATIWGQVISSKCVIRIEAALLEQVKRTTILHEVLHVVADHIGRPEVAADEGLVNALAHGMLQVLRDNPGLAKRLLED
jgi:hypothetical protein